MIPCRQGVPIGSSDIFATTNTEALSWLMLVVETWLSNGFATAAEVQIEGTIPDVMTTTMPRPH